jgi:DNA-binding MarR family transcriptional regulator
MVDVDATGTRADARVSQPPLNEGTRLLMLIGQAYRQSRRTIEQSVRAQGVTLAQFSILYSIAMEPGLSGIDVADRAFITPQAAHAALTTLQRKGLVERTEESAHRRLVCTRLTDKGARTLTTCLHQLSESGADTAGGLSLTKKRGLSGLLEEFVKTETQQGTGRGKGTGGDD